MHLPLIDDTCVSAESVNPAVFVPNSLEHLCLAIVVGDIAMEEGCFVSKLFGQSFVGLDVRHSYEPSLARKIAGEGLAHTGLYKSLRRLLFWKRRGTGTHRSTRYDSDSCRHVCDRFLFCFPFCVWYGMFFVHISIFSSKRHRRTTPAVLGIRQPLQSKTEIRHRTPREGIGMAAMVCRMQHGDKILAQQGEGQK